MQLLQYLQSPVEILPFKCQKSSQLRHRKRHIPQTSPLSTLLIFSNSPLLHATLLLHEFLAVDQRKSNLGRAKREGQGGRQRHNN
jgi:hypothetical protein